MSLLIAAANTGEATGLLCTLLLIVAVVLTAILILSLLGVSVGPVGRRDGVAGYGYLGGPVVATVVAWVLYVLLC